MEEWKQIQDLPVDYYYVSSKGRIKTVDHIDCLGRKKKGHVVKQSFDKYGYKRLTFHLAVSGKEVFCNKLIHRLVAIAFIDNPENLCQVNHIDGDKTNNDVKNLEWCTAKQNVQHSITTGLRKTGEDTRQARFTNAEVLNIRNLLANGVSQAQIAKMYKCPYSTIKNIARKRSWRYLE